MSTKDVHFQASLVVPRNERKIDVSICEESLLQIVIEVASPLNLHAAQVRFGVHEPTATQLWNNYRLSGGLQRCINGMEVANASTL